MIKYYLIEDLAHYCTFLYHEYSIVKHSPIFEHFCMSQDFIIIYNATVHICRYD